MSNPGRNLTIYSQPTTKMSCPVQAILNEAKARAKQLRHEQLSTTLAKHYQFLKKQTDQSWEFAPFNTGKTLFRMRYLEEETKEFRYLSVSARQCFGENYYTYPTNKFIVSVMMTLSWDGMVEMDLPDMQFRDVHDFVNWLKDLQGRNLKEQIDQMLKRSQLIEADIEVESS